MSGWKTMIRYGRSSGRTRKLHSSSGIFAPAHIGGIAITIDAVVARVGIAAASVVICGVGHEALNGKHDS